MDICFFLVICSIYGNKAFFVLLQQSKMKDVERGKKCVCHTESKTRADEGMKT